MVLGTITRIFTQLQIDPSDSLLYAGTSTGDVIQASETENVQFVSSYFRPDRTLVICVMLLVYSTGVRSEVCPVGVPAGQPGQRQAAQLGPCQGRCESGDLVLAAAGQGEWAHQRYQD